MWRCGIKTALKKREAHLKRKHGIRTQRSQHECQWRQPSCLPIALALIRCDMQLHECVQNSFDADRPRRAGTHGLAARIVVLTNFLSCRKCSTRRVGGPAHAWVADTGVAQRLIQHLNVRSFPNFAQLSSIPTSF